MTYASNLAAYTAKFSDSNGRNPSHKSELDHVLAVVTDNLNVLQSVAVESVVSYALDDDNIEEYDLPDYANDFIGSYGLIAICDLCKEEILTLDTYLLTKFADSRSLYCWFTIEADSRYSLDRLNDIDSIADDQSAVENLNDCYTPLELLIAALEEENFNYLLINQMTGSGVGLYEIFENDYKHNVSIC